MTAKVLETLNESKKAAALGGKCRALPGAGGRTAPPSGEAGAVQRQVMGRLTLLAVGIDEYDAKLDQHGDYCFLSKDFKSWRYTNSGVSYDAIRSVVARLHGKALFLMTPAIPAKVFLEQHGYMPAMLSKSQFSRRLSGIPESVWRSLAKRPNMPFHEMDSLKIYLANSFPVPVCRNIRM